MARVCFTQNLAGHVRCPGAECAGATVREVLDAYFDGRVSDQGAEWRHVSAHLPPIHAVRVV